MKSSDNDVIGFIKEDIAGISVRLEQVELHGSINVFIISTDNEDVLKNSWEKIRNRIAMYFQRHLESDFERWNLYLLFICPESISKTIKYKIENDRVSSRKIVVDKYEEELTNEAISKLIARYINFTFSLPVEGEEILDSYNSTSTIYRLITEKKVSKTRNKDKDLESLYSQIIDELS